MGCEDDGMRARRKLWGDDTVDSRSRVLGYLNIPCDHTKYLTHLKFDTADPFPGLRLEHPSIIYVSIQNLLYTTKTKEKI